MEKGWTKVFNDSDEYRVSIAKHLLEDHKIESVVINHKDSTYVWMGEIELYVRNEQEAQAKDVLEQLIIG